MLGSGIEIEDNLILTAKHLSCPDGQGTYVYEGEEWLQIPDTDNYQSRAYDVRILVDGKKHPTLLFRDGVRGERSTGYGAAFGTDGLYTQGYVMRLAGWQLYTSNPPIGGLSGSALYGDDGEVIGMVVVSVIDSSHGTAVTGAIGGGTLKEMIQSFKENVQYSGSH